MIGTPKRMKAIFFPRPILFKTVRGHSRAIELWFGGDESVSLQAMESEKNVIIIINMEEKQCLFGGKSTAYNYYKFKGIHPRTLMNNIAR